MRTETVIQEKSGMVNGPAGKIYVEEKGVEGMPVVFLHSFCGSTRDWANQVDHLRKDYRTINIDLRGHGKSDTPSDNDFSISSLVADLEKVVDDLQLSQFVIVGHSMGGAIAIAYAGKHPERVAGLVLAGTPGRTPQEQSKPVIASLESEAYQQVMDQYMKQLLEGARPETDSLVDQGYKKVSREASLSIIRSLFQFDPIPDLKGYKGLVMIVSTERETKQPNTLAKQMPDIPTETFTGTSHWIQLDKPEEFNRLLDDFLKKFSKT